VRCPRSTHSYGSIPDPLADPLVPFYVGYGLARYSVSNLLLILLAKPNASFVVGFKAWLDLGYCVRRGEHGIRIFAKRALSL
jgi:hypothetical protein